MAAAGLKPVDNGFGLFPIQGVEQHAAFRIAVLPLLAPGRQYGSPDKPPLPGAGG
jgi:hypothetical protein